MGNNKKILTESMLREKVEDMVIDEIEKTYMNNLDGMSEEDINLMMYDGDEDYMNLDNELIEYISKGRDIFEDMRDTIENSRTYTNEATRHKIMKRLKMVEDICEIIEELWYK